MRPLVIYFALAYLFSWIIWLPLYGPAFGLHGLPQLAYHHALGGLGPLLASVLLTWRFGRGRGLKQLLASCLKATPLVYLLVALFSPFLLALVAALFITVFNGGAYNVSGLLSSAEFPQFGIAAVFLYNLVFFGFGEEVGWRGFALPRLQRKFNALWSSVLLTLFWALWHWPLFFYRPGYTAMDAAGILGWIFSLLTGSVLLTWLFNASRGSLLICAIFHSTIDIAFTADLGDNRIVSYMGALITVWGLLTLVIFKPGDLSRSGKVIGEASGG